MMMKQNALAVFRQPPERLNCAQSVLHGYRQVSGDTTISLSEMKLSGAGGAPGGLCGALYAACTVIPDKADALKTDFGKRLGSTFCKELRAARQYPCEMCVAQAAELLQTEARP